MFLEYAIAQNAHKGQVDKAGFDYMYHVSRVADKFHGNDLFASAALLHDVLEDTSVTEEDLINYGVNKLVVDVVVILTRKKDEKYKDYIQRVCKDYVATSIKIQDISDHLRDKNVLEDSMIMRYAKALTVLEHSEHMKVRRM